MSGIVDRSVAVLVVAVMLICVSSRASAGIDAPAEAVQQLLRSRSAAECFQHCTERMQRRMDVVTELWSLAARVEPTLHVVPGIDAKALVLVSFASVPITYYVHVVANGAIHEIDGIASFPLSLTVHEEYTALQRLPSRTPDEVARWHRLSLLAGADSVLVAFAGQHLATLAQCVELYQSGKRSQSLKLANSIMVETIDEAAEQGSRRLEFILGEGGSSAVGVFYAPSQTDVPALSDTDYIYIEPIAPMWYVFRSL